MKRSTAIALGAAVGGIASLRHKSKPQPVAEPEYLTVEDAIELGIIDRAGIEKANAFPSHGITVMDHDRNTQMWFAGWTGPDGYKAHLKSMYLGGKSPLTAVPVGNPIRDAITDISTAPNKTIE